MLLYGDVLLLSNLALRPPLRTLDMLGRFMNSPT